MNYVSAIDELIELLEEKKNRVGRYYESICYTCRKKAFFKGKRCTCNVNASLRRECYLVCG